MSKYPKITASPRGADESVSFASTGPVLVDNQPVTNDHSTLTDVAGQQVWLHREKHHYDGNGHVHMPFHHAVDVGLAPPSDEQEAEDTKVIPPATATATKLDEGRSGHKADDVLKPQPVSAMSNTATDNKANTSNMKK